VVASCTLRADGRTDKRTERHDETKSHFLQFFERIWKLSFVLLLRPKPRHILLNTQATAHFKYADMISDMLIIYFVVPSSLTASIHTKSICSTFRSFIPSCYPNYSLFLPNSFNGKIEVIPETFLTMRVFPFEGVYMLCNVSTSLCYHTLQ